MIVANPGHHHTKVTARERLRHFVLNSRGPGLRIDFTDEPVLIAFYENYTLRR